MPYTNLPTDHIADPHLRRAFVHASVLLADCYAMLGLEEKPATGAGGCNFPLGLVLACILDGLATEVYPIEVGDRIKPRARQYARLRKLLSERLAWGSTAHGWITLAEATGVIWAEIRNPLAHNLGADTKPKQRRRGFSDAAIIRRLRDGTLPDADAVDQATNWDKKSPVMWAKSVEEGGSPRIVVSAPALYWHVKRLAADLASDTDVLSRALVARRARR